MMMITTEWLKQNGADTYDITEFEQLLKNCPYCDTRWYGTLEDRLEWLGAVGSRLALWIHYKITGLCDYAVPLGGKMYGNDQLKIITKNSVVTCTVIVCDD